MILKCALLLTLDQVSFEIQIFEISFPLTVRTLNTNEYLQRINFLPIF